MTRFNGRRGFRWVLVVAIIGWAGALRAETRWPRWRGPRGDGHSTETALPVQWGADAVAWKTDVPGRGQSSPIVWDERIFLTTASEDGLKRSIVCLNRADGSQLWEQSVPWQGESESLHKMNTWATPSCATDGKVVIAFFGRAGLHAYTVDGKHLWSNDLGSFDNPWGVAACPVLVGDLVIQNGDADTDAFIAAYNKQTGELAWRQPRPNHRGWSTPILVETDKGPELTVNGHAGVTAYDPQTGKQLWFCKSFNGRGEPTVTPGKGLVYVVNGLSGDVYSIQPGGEGDVTQSRMAWHTPRKVGRDLPSPILIDDYLIVVSMRGVGVCYNAINGEVIWQDRLGGNYSASPIAAGGLAYFLAEDGSTVVIKPGAKLEIVARNQLAPEADEIFRASPTPCEGQLLLRSDRALYCIGKRNKG
ncbi:MAG TPA: PQQ-binding-like beta-propeller repeat protein [Pirellulales bacterium]|nr:PQQ-binding-like beta-propeller repeat protein [Pirellulales bacterium]